MRWLMPIRGRLRRKKPGTLGVTMLDIGALSRWRQGWIGQNQVRQFRFSGNTLTLEADTPGWHATLVESSEPRHLDNCGFRFSIPFRKSAAGRSPL
jgi:hypothetical protein